MTPSNEMRIIIVIFLLVLSLSIAAGQSTVTDFNSDITYVTCYIALADFWINTTSSEDTDSLCWDFDDGRGSHCNNYSNGNSCTYSQPGSYTVSLIVWKNGIKNEITKPNLITIRNPPNVEFDIDFENQDSIFAPVNINFINETIKGDGDTLKYSWDFGDNCVSNETNPAHTFITPRTYYVSLTVADNYGCIVTSTDAIVVKDTAQINEIGYVTGLHTNNVNVLFEHFDTIYNETLKITGYILANCCTRKTVVLNKTNDTIFIKSFETGPECTCEDFYDFEIKIPGIDKDSILVSFNGKLVMAKSNLTSIGKSAIDELIKIYPNPASNCILIDLTGYKFNHITVKIFDLLGHDVFETSQPQNNELIINNIFLKPGVYIVNFIFDNDKSFSSSKLMIKNAR